jgi:hypothetical protein
MGTSVLREAGHPPTLVSVVNSDQLKISAEDVRMCKDRFSTRPISNRHSYLSISTDLQETQDKYDHN